MQRKHGNINFLKSTFLKLMQIKLEISGKIFSKIFLKHIKQLKLKENKVLKYFKVI